MQKHRDPEMSVASCRTDNYFPVIDVSSLQILFFKSSLQKKRRIEEEKTASFPQQG